ncbi:GTPase-activating protein [Paenibacillus thiaminolyticus]|uniref:GTPase-activating protein n=1 Tax=Paenibacillus thiaminolyticus TaxID=49283 RepID=UPI002542702A|nr:GTPase-activating protein [Paenibacillus thiaminolyticus]WII39160.1 GTPase-activating protein [Paenibacillus thiaminolyticus]
MAQSFTEIAKEITIAAIEKGILFRKSNTSRTENTLEELNSINADEIGKFYKTVAKHVNDAITGKFED